MARLEWTDELKQQLSDLVAQGLSYRQAAKAMGIRPGQARGAALYYGIAPATPRAPWRDWDRQEYDLVEELLEQGLGYEQIARRMGITPNQAKGAAQRLGLTTRHDDKHLVSQVGQVLEAIGGVPHSDRYNRWWEFDYAPGEAVGLIVASGVIPDHQSHQFYPTPPGLAARAAELAEIEPHHRCLEPSAGTGALADHFRDAAKKVCVEVSKLHCQVLEAKGHNVVEADFLEWAEEQDAMLGGYDRILMNPPFSQGRWQAHTEAAATMLAPGGRLVAILPSSAQGSFHLPGLACRWDGPHYNQFAGASVSVSVLIADKEEAALAGRKG